MFLILLTIATPLLIYFLFIKPFYYWSDRGVAQNKIRTVWMQMILGLTPFKSIVESGKQMYDDFPNERYFGAYQFLRPLLIARDPDLIKQIMVKDFDHFTDHNEIIPVDSTKLWDLNLFALKGDKWREMRSTLSPSFTSSKMKNMFHLVSECGEQYIQYLQEQQNHITVMEMKDFFTRYSNDVIATTAFGVICNSKKNKENEFYMMGKQLINFRGFFRTLSLLTIFTFPKLAKVLGLSFFGKRPMDYFKKVISDNIEIREKQKIKRPDMIDLLMEARKTNPNQTDSDGTIKDNGKLDINDITAQALIFFIAGFDTVATLMSFMAYELAVNVDVQEKLQKEIAETLDSSGGVINYDSLMKMKYLDMVVSETLRKWPPSIVSDRVCVKPYTITNPENETKSYTLNKGDMIWLPLFALHRDPKHYEQPDTFDPERFNEENKSSRSPYTYIPFGAGPRMCIGNRFALMETKLIFFHILSKYDIVVIDKTTVPLKIAKSQFQLASEGGFWLGLKPKN